MVFKFYFKKPQIKSYLYNPLNGTQNMPKPATDRNLFFFLFFLNHTIGRYAIMVKFCSQVLLNLFFDTQILALLSLIFMLVKSALVAITIVS